MLEKLDLDIKKITIPLPFKLDHVHCFIAENNQGYTLIDTGLNNKETAEIWKEHLHNKQVNRIILTHLHPDHAGYAGTLQKNQGAEVWMTEKDSMALSDIWQPSALPRLKMDYEAAAIPEHITNGIIEITEKFIPYVTPVPEINHFIKDGDKIQLGKDEYTVITTPGHSAGLFCLYQEEKSVLFATDHILPKITPNIAYWFYGEANPLKSFQESLEKIKQLDAEIVIPSHGEPFIGANKRIEELWAHHERRLEKVMQHMDSGMTVFETCKLLFPRELSIYDYQFAIGETIAHLEYLYQEKMLARELKDG